MNIFAVGLNAHDHNTYDGALHKQYERYTRYKYNMIDPSIDDHSLLNQFSDEVFYPRESKTLAFTTTNGYNKVVKNNPFDTFLKSYKSEFLNFKPNSLWDYIHRDNYYYIDHHQSHLAYAYLSSGYNQSDILAIDGTGIKYRCIFVKSTGEYIDLSDELPLGYLWNLASGVCGFGTRNAGKLMGLAGYGKPNEHYYNILELQHDNIRQTGGMLRYDYKLYKVDQYSKEDFAATIQQYTLDKIREIVFPLKTCDHLCVAGGVAYNGYMNEMFTKHYTNVHVPPAVGDEGQALGAYMHADYILNNNIHIPNAYSGQAYEFDDPTFDDLNISEVAQAIADGCIVGWYQGHSESGNRALGNRSILADPRNANIKDIINSKIKLREDFRPFAPSVLVEHYQEYFDTNQPSPHMSRIVPVISNKIPGVTHVDRTARIQTVERSFNEKYYDLIYEFYKITGVPMLLNTSFNCQEPIVETPQEAINTFNKTGLDLLVINNKMKRK